MSDLVVSILHRPYVFAFLAAYLFLAWRLFGWRRTILWLVSGYIVAWASEYSSINTGFPYGEYHYVYENLSGELLVAGVPFFDSLSYVFLTFAGFTAAKFIPTKDRWLQILFGGILTTLLDVIIDPVATMGDKWFLGQIHFYAHPGWYFGVPMTNFAGWFITSLIIIAFNVISWKAGYERRATSDERPDFLYPLFYTSIALFSIVMSFWIGEWKLGIASLVILGTIIASIIVKTRQKLTLRSFDLCDPAYKLLGE